MPRTRNTLVVEHEHTWGECEFEDETIDLNRIRFRGDPELDPEKPPVLGTYRRKFLRCVECGFRPLADVQILRPGSN
jgi:hypothetical protein